MQVVRVGREAPRVPEGDVLPPERREVDDHLVALRHGDVQVGGADGPGRQPRVRGDDLEGDLVRGAGRALEVEQERAGDGRVEEAEAVLLGLDVEVGPRLAVDVDHVSVEAGRLAGWGEQGAVAVVLLRGEDQGEVVHAVALWEVERIFRWVVEDVRSGLA